MTPTTLPAAHASFLERTLEVLRSDARLVGVAAAGSYLTNTMDEFSDLDLVIVCEPRDYEAVLAARRELAASLGPLLGSFTGEHVGEPRLLICLYGPPLLHVDLKFVSLDDVARRVEEPAILWERDGRVTEALREGVAAFPMPNRDWIEERFWVWMHYCAVKLARGEWFEAIDSISLIRQLVLGPLALERAGTRPMGVRRIESADPAFAQTMTATVAQYDRQSILAALHACIALYRELRGAHDVTPIEREAVAFLDAL